MIYCFFALALLYQYIWYKRVKEFSVPKKILLLNTLICVVFLYFMITNLEFLFHEDLFSICISIISLGLLNLSVTDIKYYEISKKSYIFIIFPVVLLWLLNLEKISSLMSFVIMFFVLFIADKISNLGNIGGADLKLLLILSITFPHYNCLIFFVIVLIADIILFLVKKVIYIIQKKQDKVKVPMIVAITFAWIFLQAFVLKY